ncbi:ABC transporter G family member 23-like [Rhodnius prolixus]|uniref:ABC transporter G family member 23-like n=1 Tax=Rhodnius prolixus TaxID=13249 RepID=UPI003D18E34D
MNTDKAAVSIRGAYKTYDSKNYILKGLNMQVRQGTIYGLLGSSGCGKSTLLNSIVGLVGLDSGTVDLAVKSKSKVGFMPQAVCLYEQLTIEELFNYFATLYGMSRNKTKCRMDLMFDVLDLPDRNKCIPELSGGQQRRVSLAIALIHDPELLMLDEPTVGVDPILRHRIWEFLVNWCENGDRTVIITTHYIEETKQAHTVGLMREGVMISEKSPYVLMEECNTLSLEEAFLKLSKQQICEENILAPVKSKELTFSPLTINNETFTKARFLAEFKKNLTFLWRNFSVALFVFGLPIACILLFYYGNGREPDLLSLGVINNDIISCRNYSHQPHICDLNYLSCNYLHHLRKKQIYTVEFKEVETAIGHIKDTDIWGVLHFSPDFTNALSTRLNEPSITDPEIVSNSTIAAYMDSSNKIIYELLRRKLRDSYTEMGKEIYRACGYPEEFINLPVKFEKPIYGNANPSFQEFVSPALIIILIFAMPLSYSIVVIEEKNSGAMSRSIVAGTTVFEVLAGHILGHIVVQLFQIFSCMIMMYWILQFPLVKPFLSTVLLILVGLAGTAVSFTLSTSFNSVPVVASLCTGCVMGSLMLGGMMWPTEGMHPAIKVLSWFAPNTFSTQSLRSLSIRGWDMTNRDVYLGFISSCSWIVVFTFITYIYVKRNKAKSFLSKNI